MVQAIVTDIEGTTSSLSFVKDVLFPYARTHLAGFVATHAH
jgi:enolase-phosphatase E1